MNEELPKDLAGWQHLAPDEVTQDGDVGVENGRATCRPWAGQRVGDWENGDFLRVYRRIPVAKQGDLHEQMFNKEPQPAMLPTDPAARKKLPIYSGFLAYFPDAVAAVAECSRVGNDQHSPGKPLFWDRSKSGDEADALVRHLMQHGTVDTDGIRHSIKVCWRAMALAQKEIEAERLSEKSTKSP